MRERVDAWKPRLAGAVVVMCMGVFGGQAVAAPTPAKSKSSSTPDAELVRRIVRSLEDAKQQSRFSTGMPNAVSDADYRPLDADQVELGKLLFHDKILSGNQNISCATCHNMLTDTSDGLSLPVGEGGLGLGPAREVGFGSDRIHERVPRNAPHVFNIGAFEFDVMMHDGRIAADPDAPSGFNTPAGDDLMHGLDSTVAAQACFPVTSFAEMAGQPGENIVANYSFQGDFPKLWAYLAKRVALVPEYADMFAEVYDDVQVPQDITYTHIANAIAAYESAVGRADDSPFDQYLRGDTGAMSPNAIEGMTLFYGKAGCASCHSGPFQTNHEFAAIAMPQIGPGKGHNQAGYIDGYDDLGRGGQFGIPEDNFKFRIPSLRNVELTGPWGHSGAYTTLEGVVRHHLDPVNALYNYDQRQAVLPYDDELTEGDFLIMNTPERVAGIAAANELAPIDLTDREVDRVIDFLHSLTDHQSIDVRWAIPLRVPSGLPVYD